MKRFLTLTLMLLIIFSLLPQSAFADDFSSLTDVELIAVLDAARAELSSRNFKAENKRVLYEDSIYQVYINGEISYWDSALYLIIPVVIINKGTETMEFQLRDEAVNGWSCESHFSKSIPAGKKAAEELVFDLKGTDVTSLDVFEDVEFSFCIFDWNNMASQLKTDLVIITK